MLKFKIDKKILAHEISKISTWEDWDKIRDEIFRRDEWEDTDIETIGKDLERPTVVIDGYKWESTTNSYELSPELFYLHEKTRWEVFAKLDPEADADNKNHPERYGKWCVYCKRWSREYPESNCPQCGNELLPLPLNE